MSSILLRGASLLALALLGLAACERRAAPAGPAPAPAAAADPLPSWNEGHAKHAIIAFVTRIQQPGPGHVPADERIAVFDHDGTLWAEQPRYFEVAFAIDRARQLAEGDPALAAKPAFAAAASGDPARLAALSEKDFVQLIGATHSGMTTDQFPAVVETWLATARHPTLNRPYLSLVYQPQLELLAYLRQAGFKTFIVSGGGVDFMRVFARQTYDIPPYQVIGSSGKGRFELDGDKATVFKEAKLGSVDDAAGKPENIALHIGRRPLIAVGNSDGDLQMLQYVAGGGRPSLEVLVHHDDEAREFAYDRQSKVGRLDKALTEASARGWTVVSMKRDWATVFPAAAPGS